MKLTELQTSMRECKMAALLVLVVYATQQVAKLAEAHVRDGDELAVVLVAQATTQAHPFGTQLDKDDRRECDECGKSQSQYHNNQR